jgi:hypothetical protein
MVGKAYPATAAVSGYPMVIGGQDQADATTAILYLIVAPFAGRITSVDILDTTALARGNTDFMTVTVTNLGAAGAGTTVMACASTEIYDGSHLLGLAADVVGYVPSQVPFVDAAGAATAQSAQNFSAGDVISVVAAASSGGAFTAGRVIVRAVQGQ